MSMETKHSPEPTLPVDPDLQFVKERLGGNRKLIAAIVAIGVIGAGLYTLLVPPEYEARTSIILPAGSESSAAMGLAAQFGLGGGAGSTGSLAMFGAILDSERMLNTLVESSKIEKKKLREQRSVNRNDQSNLIEIKFRDKNPDTAISLANQSLEALRKFTSELSLPSKSQRAEMLKEKIDEGTQRLRELELRFEKFARESKSIPSGVTDEKSEVNVFTQRAQLAGLKREVQKLEASEAAARKSLQNLSGEQGAAPSDIPQLQQTYEELRKVERDLVTLKATYTKEYPLVQQNEKRAQALREQLRSEARKYAESYNQGLVRDVNELRVAKQTLRNQIRELEIIVEAAPEEATEFERLRREMKVMETLLIELTVKYEQAAMDEATDPNRWEVLDEPQLADKPVNKRFGLSLGIGFAASLFVAIVAALSIKPKA